MLSLIRVGIFRFGLIFNTLYINNQNADTNRKQLAFVSTEEIKSIQFRIMEIDSCFIDDFLLTTNDHYMYNQKLSYIIGPTHVYYEVQSIL